MKLSKKKIIINAFFLCFLVTAHILFEVFSLKNNIFILNVIAKYTVAITTGILFEIYCELIRTTRIYKDLKKEKGYLSLLKISMVSGIVFWGVGMGIFLFILFTLLLGYQININNFLFLFITCLVGGAIWGLIMFIIYSLINIIKKRNNKLEPKNT